MSLHELHEGEALPQHRSDVVVVIPLYGAHDHFVRCLSSVLAHTPAGVPIVVADDATPDPASLSWAKELDVAGVIKHDVVWAATAQNLGFVGNCNRAFALAGRADVVLLNSDCVVAEGWLDGLRDAAHGDSINATATALTNHGTIVSVPARNAPRAILPQETNIDAAAAAVRAASPRLHPRLPAAIGHCVWIRRTALDLLGGFDEAFAPAYGEEVDFSQRCLLNGLQHVLADDVLVEHHGGGSLDVGGERNPLQKAHDAIIDSRYGYYTAVVKAVETDPASPLARTLAVASRVLRQPSVTIDARCLGSVMTGTQLHTLELIGALWRSRRVHLRVVLPDIPGEYARSTLAVMPGLELMAEWAVDEDTPRTDVVHRAYQVSGPDDLRFLDQLGERLVITNQDLIAYRNPGYFPSSQQYLRYRRFTAEALAMASIVAFFSQHAADDAIAEDLISPERARVVPIGVDHRLGSLRPEPARPANAPADLEARPFLLCIGTRFRHKNRVFAIRLLESLRERHGWEGRLVFAGPEVAEGSSSGDEAAYLAPRTGLAEHVLDVASVDEAEKWWLYEHCAGVVYPTIYEGFGLIPFEAAQVQRPCFFARQASLAELLPESAEMLVPWEPDASADRVIEVLRDDKRAAALLDEIEAAAQQLTWAQTAEGLLAAYDDAVRLPARDMMRLHGDALIVDARYWNLRQAIGPTGLSLVDPDKRLLPADAQRAIAGLARRSTTRKPLLAALRAVHRVSTRASGTAIEARDVATDADDPPVERRDDNGRGPF